MSLITGINCKYFISQIKESIHSGGKIVHLQLEVENEFTQCEEDMSGQLCIELNVSAKFFNDVKSTA
jgi:hypothetical protein